MNVWICQQKIILWPTIALLFCLALADAQVRAATFIASLDRETIALGEIATLSLTFEGGSPQTAPMPPNIPGLKISYVEQSNQYSYSKEQTNSTVPQQCRVTPGRSGEFITQELMAD